MNFNKKSASEAMKLMRTIAENEKSGNMAFSNLNGEDHYSEESNMDGFEYGNLTGGGNAQHGQIESPQTDLTLNLINSTGVAASTIVHAAQTINVSLFGGTTSLLGGLPAIGITSNEYPNATNTPATSATLNVSIDGRLYSNDSNVSGADLTITGNPRAYNEIVAESLHSPFVLSTIRIDCASQLQLIQGFTIAQANILGVLQYAPYTTSNKRNPMFQAQTTIIDQKFGMKVVGNNSLKYTMLSPAAATPSSVTTPNQVTLTWLMSKQAVVGRTLSGKSAIISSNRGIAAAGNPYKVIGR